MQNDSRATTPKSVRSSTLSHSPGILTPTGWSHSPGLLTPTVQSHSPAASGSHTPTTESHTSTAKHLETSNDDTVDLSVRFVFKILIHFDFANL